MPPSQLKALKSKLREQGILGPQQSKKQRKQNAQNGLNKDRGVNRKVALNGIREQFNPFEFQQAGGKAPKFPITTIEGKKGKRILRPGLQKSREEEMRNTSISEEYYNRNKVGGVIDKRFGENDPTMAPEDKMLERYTQAQLRGKNKGSVFDLEDDEPGELTHMGMSLSLNGPDIQDDFEEQDLELSDADEDHPKLKRHRSDMEGVEEEEEEEGKDDEGLPERKKSKQEVMKEVIAKSKLHKYERQAAKDDDDDLREVLDKEMPNIHALLRGFGQKASPAPLAAFSGMNPDRLAFMHGIEKAKIEKDYDVRLRQLAQDQRSKPTEKSKIEEQIIEERARKLQDLEAKRLRRMQGAPESSDDEDVKGNSSDEDEVDEFGLGAGIKARLTMAELGFDDEDDFLIDDGLVASGPEMDDSDAELLHQDEASEDEEDDDEFIKGLLTEEEAERPEFLTGANGPVQDVEDLAKNGVSGDLAFDFACPQTHEELLQVVKNVAILDLPAAIQRIRTIYSPKLKSENKGKVAKFAVALVDHISYLANQENSLPFTVLETVIRHIHSLAKTYALEIANAFRRHLDDIRSTRALSITPGDLVIFTAIGTIFPTSDHFHQVVTPSILSMARSLGLKIPRDLSDYVIGTYLCSLCIQYQRLSKRYVPEVMNFIENTLCILAPKNFARLPGHFPSYEPKTSMRITSTPQSTRKLAFYDCIHKELSEEEQSELKIAIMEADLRILVEATDLWAGLASYTEIFEPVSKIVKHLGGKENRKTLPESTIVLLSILSKKLSVQLQTARLKRCPLELHHHRPLAIKMAIAKFEESFNPHRHYDPDRERTETAKLKKEYKREHKGAVRALRKDAKITATRQLRDKRERDEAYEKNQKRLMAMIQGEEGREQKAYAREKEWRKKGKK